MLSEQPVKTELVIIVSTDPMSLRMRREQLQQNDESLLILPQERIISRVSRNSKEKMESLSMERSDQKQQESSHPSQQVLVPLDELHLPREEVLLLPLEELAPLQTDPSLSSSQKKYPERRAAV